MLGGLNLYLYVLGLGLLLTFLVTNCLYLFFGELLYRFLKSNDLFVQLIYGSYFAA